MEGPRPSVFVFPAQAGIQGDQTNAEALGSRLRGNDRLNNGIWRRDPESNWADRICNPVHNRFAIAPYPQKREAVASLFLKLEREKSLELSTSTLARLRSTN